MRSIVRIEKIKRRR